VELVVVCGFRADPEITRKTQNRAPSHHHGDLRFAHVVAVGDLYAFLGPVGIKMVKTFVT